MGTPKRKFRFVSGSTLEILDTSFEVQYDAQPRDDGPPLLFFKIRGAWQFPSGADGLAKRKWIEDRMMEIAWTWVGRVGTVTIALQSDGTWAGTGSRVISNVKLERLVPETSDNNVAFEYSLEFSSPIANGRIARALSFGLKNVTAENFIVQKDTSDDRTQFKPVWRAGHVRIPDGPPLKILRVMALRSTITGANDLAKRQAVETEYSEWAQLYKGTEALLSIDSVNLGAHHLKNVSPINLDYIDAIAFELEFWSNYGS